MSKKLLDNLHTTSMTSEQRKMLIHTLSQFHDMKDLAQLTDREIHLQWLADCEYCSKELAPIKYKEAPEFRD